MKHYRILKPFAVGVKKFLAGGVVAESLLRTGQIPSLKRLGMVEELGADEPVPKEADSKTMRKELEKRDQAIANLEAALASYEKQIEAKEEIVAKLQQELADLKAEIEAAQAPDENPPEDTPAEEPAGQTQGQQSKDKKGAEKQAAKK